MIQRKIAAVVVAAAGTVLIGLATVPGTKAQSQTFEAAVVKPTNSSLGDFRRGACQGADNKIAWTVPLGRCVYTRLTLKELLFYAYYTPLMNLFPTEQLIAGGPGWASQDYFDIEAKAEDSTKATHSELLLMLQTFLNDRFKLQIHHENKELEGYVLAQARNGSKLTVTAEGHACEGVRNEGRPGLRSMVGNCVDSQNISRILTGLVHAPVVDRSGLAGSYDFRLEWTPGPGEPGAAPAGEPSAGPSLVTAVQEQLGLKLEPQKIPTDTIVIDRAEKPFQN